jgi:uncharacterized protein YggU (UPF0235/DUF167 family)
MTVIQVRVKPHAKISALEDAGDGTFVAHVKARPVDGAANDELIELVAHRFGCPKAAVSIKSGTASRIKRVKIGKP